MLQLIFVFSLFLGKVMYGNEFKTKEKTKMDLHKEINCNNNNNNKIISPKNITNLGHIQRFSPSNNSILTDLCSAFSTDGKCWQSRKQHMAITISTVMYYLEEIAFYSYLNTLSTDSHSTNRKHFLCATSKTS